MNNEELVIIKAMAHDAAVASWDAHGQYVTAEEAFEFIKKVRYEEDDRFYNDYTPEFKVAYWEAASNLNLTRAGYNKRIGYDKVFISGNLKGLRVSCSFSVTNDLSATLFYINSLMQNTKDTPGQDVGTHSTYYVENLKVEDL